MANNPFAQFDVGMDQPAPSSPGAAPSGANPFAQYDPAGGVVHDSVAKLQEISGQPEHSDFGLGFYQGFARPFRNFQRDLEAIPVVGEGLHWLDKLQGIKTGQEQVQDLEHQREQAAAEGRIPSPTGEFLGEVAGTAPIALATRNPWAAGAATGALLSDKEDLPGILEDTGIGALGGKAGDVALQGLGRIISPRLSAGVQMLKDMGVQLTPGQILGGWGKRLEDAATSIPFIGDAIQGAQRRSVLSFNKAVINKALEPIGASLPKDVQTGHDAVAYAGDQLSNAYESLLPHLSVSADQPFATGINNARQSLSGLPADKLAQFDNVMRDHVLSRFNMVPTGQNTAAAYLNGQGIKDMESQLGQLGRSYVSSPDPDQRALGAAYNSVRDELRDMITRQNPAAADDLAKINQGWALLTRIERAAGKANPAPGADASGGVFSPQQLLTSVRQADSTARKRGFARGTAMLQDVAEAGKSVLPSTVPDSGTARRMLASGAVLGAGGSLLHLLEPASMATVLGSAAGYSPAGVRALRILLAERPQAAPAIAHAITTHLRDPAILTGALAASGVPASAQTSQNSVSGGDGGNGQGMRHGGKVASFARGGHVESKAADVDATPSEAQIQAGNYRKGHISFQGIPITVETPKGIARRGIGADGKPWENTHFLAHYGYIKRTEGADGEHVDTYVGPHADSNKVWVVDQHDPETGAFDEHKVVLGARTLGEAMRIYDRGFSDGSGKRRRKSMSVTTVAGLKRWLKDGRTDKLSRLAWKK